MKHFKYILHYSLICFFQEYLPNTRPHIAISSLPNGRKLYDDYLRWHLSTSISADNLHNLGRSEIDRIHGCMKKVDFTVFFSYIPDIFIKIQITLIGKKRYISSTIPFLIILIILIAAVVIYLLLSKWCHIIRKTYIQQIQS